MWQDCNGPCLHPVGAQPNPQAHETCHLGGFLAGAIVINTLARETENLEDMFEAQGPCFKSFGATGYPTLFQKTNGRPLLLHIRLKVIVQAIDGRWKTGPSQHLNVLQCTSRTEAVRMTCFWTTVFLMRMTIPAYYHYWVLPSALYFCIRTGWLPGGYFLQFLMQPIFNLWVNKNN